MLNDFSPTHINLFLQVNESRFPKGDQKLLMFPHDSLNIRDVYSLKSDCLVLPKN